MVDSVKLSEKNCTFVMENRKKTAMTTREYDTSSPVTMASEPTGTYIVNVGKRKKTSQNQGMTVDEYFDKVRKALDKLHR